MSSIKRSLIISLIFILSNRLVLLKNFNVVINFYFVIILYIIYKYGFEFLMFLKKVE
jgi:hypothetical protein